jgi:hypothetical protein
MKCDCYEKAFSPVIRLLEKASGEMYYATPEFDEHQQMLHDIIVSMNTKFRCIDSCWEKVRNEDYEYPTKQSGS